MNGKVIGFLIVVALVAAGLNGFTYIVNQTEDAVKLRFGDVVDSDIAPGLHFKIPFMNNIKKFDTRVKALDLAAETYTTSGKKRVEVDSFAQWQITNTKVFYKNTSGDVARAERILSSRVNDSLRAQFGKLTLTDVISGQRDELMQEASDDISRTTEEELGIRVLDVRIKGIELSSAVKNDVYNRMKSEREREAKGYRAAGEKEAESIRADADKQRTTLLAEAYATAETVRGEGDALATNTYSEAYTKDAEFYRFTRSLKAYEDSINEGDILVLDKDSEFFQYLQ